MSNSAPNDDRVIPRIKKTHAHIANDIFFLDVQIDYATDYNIVT